MEEGNHFNILTGAQKNNYYPKSDTEGVIKETLQKILSDLNLISGEFSEQLRGVENATYSINTTKHGEIQGYFAFIKGLVDRRRNEGAVFDKTGITMNVIILRHAKVPTKLGESFSEIIHLINGDSLEIRLVIEADHSAKGITCERLVTSMVQVRLDEMKSNLNKLIIKRILYTNGTKLHKNISKANRIVLDEIHKNIFREHKHII